MTLSVPVAALLSITSGFLFGPWLGAICAVIGATLGATIVFLAVRAGSAGLVERAGQRIRRLEAGFRDVLKSVFARDPAARRDGLRRRIWHGNPRLRR